MNLTKEKIKAVCFDYGNTLIEFGPAAFKNQYAAIEKTLTNLFGHCDADRLKIIRDGQIKAPFANGFHENNMRRITEELIASLYRCRPQKKHVDAVIQARYDAFVESVSLAEGVRQLLEKLHRRYLLGLISNYPCSRSINDSLLKIGLLDLFDEIVVSGDCGFVKPHAKPFKLMLYRLSVNPCECIFVGDNWLADVQGAKRMGIHAVLTTEHEPYDYFEPSPGDHMPDARIDRIEELGKLIL